jgi:hypothetical protein
MGKDATPRHRALDVFTRRELYSQIVRPSGLTLVQPLDREVSAETWGNVQSFVHSGGDFTIVPATGEPFPHLIVQVQGPGPLKTIGSPWTSVALAMVKPPA